MIRDRNVSRTVVMVLHGNAGCAMEYVDSLKNKFPRMDIFCVEYPGFGWNFDSGRPSIENCAGHVREIYDSVLYTEYAHVHVVAYGIGTIIAPRAFEYSKSEKISSFVLLAPMDDLEGVVSHNTGIPTLILRTFLGREPTREYWRKMTEMGYSKIKFHVLIAGHDTIVSHERSLVVAKWLPSDRTHIHVFPVDHHQLITYL